LDVADLDDATGAVGTPLPRASADEEDADEGEQDEDDDRQFEERHTGLAIHDTGVCQFHGFICYLVILLFWVYFCLCLWREKDG
jgi:hypothetical protein